MNFVVIAILIVTSYYEATFSKALWKRKNYLGAVGVIVITVLSIAAPVTIILRD